MSLQQVLQLARPHYNNGVASDAQKIFGHETWPTTNRLRLLILRLAVTQTLKERAFEFTLPLRDARG